VLLTESAISGVIEDVIKCEGGYWDDPYGGPTNCGITQRTLDNLQKSDLCVPARVQDLEEQDVVAIYREKYFRPFRLERFPLPVAQKLMHLCVMSWDDGIKILQELVCCANDGIVGSKTIKAVEASPLTGEQLANITVGVWLADRNDHEFIRGFANRLL
jgi:lysozyme family protein